MDPYNTADAQAPAANPYAAPAARVAQHADTGDLNKSSRGARLGAVLLDGLIASLCAIPLYIDIFRAAAQGRGAAGVQDFGSMFGMGSFVSLVALLGLLAYNLLQLHRSGQTVAKKLVGVKIVRTDGTRASLGRIVGLRYVVPGAIGAIPLLGPLFSLIDPLFIFNEEKRCIHDMLADTIVVDA